MRDHPPKRVSMRDLAKRAGVSQPTVSRALRNDPSIPESTRRRIKQMAREIGYRPDPMLSALNAYRGEKQRPSGGGTIAVLDVRKKDSSPIKDLHILLPSITERAEELGYGVEVFTLEPDPASQRQLSRILYNRGIRGVLVGPVPKEAGVLDTFDWSRVAAVSYANSLESPQLHYVAFDQRSDLVYGKLKELGYRRIGYCSSLPQLNNFRYLKLATYLKCLFMDGSSPEDSPPLIYKEANWDLIPWIEKHRFDAVMAADAFEVIAQLRRAGYSVPGDIGVVSLSLSKHDAHRHGIAASVTDFAPVGAVAVEFLHQLLCHGQLGIPRHRQAIFLENEWYPGKTVRKIRSAKKLAK